MTALPEAVRARVVSLTAEALPHLAPEHLPAALRKVATFTPGRRARLGGTAIAACVEGDEAFRGHLAPQVRALTGELGRALSEGGEPPEGDLVQAAATAYLLRSPGWQGIVARAAGSPAERGAVTGAGEEQLVRLRGRVEQLQSDQDRQRVRSREQLDRLRTENTELRRKLGETRTRLRSAERAVEDAVARAVAVEAEADRVRAAHEAEVRRLRSRVNEVETALAGARRVQRGQAVDETVRAKLLVETVVNAAAALQRELALPPIDRLPADTVTADLAGDGARTSSGRGSLAADDPSLLEELLRLPRAHLVVDGYNLTKRSWPDLPLDRQRERLVRGAAALVARTSAEVTVVFDAAESRDRPPVQPPRGVRVRFSPYGVIADDVIRDIVVAEPPGRALVVATNDQAVARDVLAGGFRVAPTDAVEALLARA